LNSSASSLETPSLSTDGTSSTAAFASLRPRPVIALTALIALIFLAPASVSTTLHSVFYSSASA